MRRYGDRLTVCEKGRLKFLFAIAGENKAVVDNLEPVRDMGTEGGRWKYFRIRNASHVEKVASLPPDLSAAKVFYSSVQRDTSNKFKDLLKNFPAYVAEVEKRNLRDEESWLCENARFFEAGGRDPETLNADSKWISEALIANRVVPAWRQAGGNMASVDPIGFVEAVHAAYKVQLPWNAEIGDYAIDGGSDSEPMLIMGNLRFAIWSAALGKLREFVRNWLSGVAPIRRVSLVDAISKATTVGQVEVAKMALAEHDEIVKKLQQLLKLYDNVDSARQTRLHNMEKHVEHMLTGTIDPNRRDESVIDSPVPPAPEEDNSVVDFAKNHPFLTGAAAVIFSEQIKNVARGSAESPVAAGFAALNANEHPVLAGMAIGYLAHEGEKAREMDKRRIVIYAEDVRDRSQKQYEVDALVKKGYEVKKHGYTSGGGSGYEWVLEPRW